MNVRDEASGGGQGSVREAAGRRPRGPDEAVRSVPAAAFAAFAESALFFIPLRLLLNESLHSQGGPLDTYPVFVVLFTAAVAAATALRRYRAVPTVVAAGGIAVGMAQAWLWSSGDVGSGVFTVVLSLLVALRVVTLAIRDWRDPMKESFALGSIVLLFEIAIGSSSQSGVRGVLPLVVAQFFLGALASRASSVRLTAPREQHERAGVEGRPERMKSPVIGIGAMAAVIGLAVLLGGRHGALRLIGQVVFLAGGWILIGLAFVLARILLKPLAWIVAKLHISFRGFSQLARHLQNLSSKSPHYPGQHGSAWDTLIRLLGLAMLALLVWVLVRTIRRYRELMGWVQSQAEPEVAATMTSLSPPRRLRKGESVRRRRELPADTVRRWYAEVLLLLERRGLAKPVARTPDEYLQDVVRAFPDCSPGFTALTRAYDDVRYGYRTIEPSSLDLLEVHRNMVMGALSKSGKIEPAQDPGEARSP